MSAYTLEFGKHVRTLRKTRGYTQDVLATRAGLSADTIRRLEKGSFAASIETIRKLCIGLDISPSTLFESFELNQTDGRRALIDLVAARGNDEIALVIRVVRALLDELDKLRVERQ